VEGLGHHLSTRLRVFPKLAFDYRQSSALVDKYGIDGTCVGPKFSAERNEGPKCRINLVGRNYLRIVEQRVSKPSFILGLYISKKHTLCFFKPARLFDKYEVAVHLPLVPKAPVMASQDVMGPGWLQLGVSNCPFVIRTVEWVHRRRFDFGCMVGFLAKAKPFGHRN
jgi:hypothetical protein